MNRRKFLEDSGKLILGSSAISGLASLFPLRALAASQNSGLPHFFLIIRVHGSMDSTLGLNPWTTERPNPKDLYLDSSYETSISANGTEINLGPSALSLLPHTPDLAVINGIFMGTTDLGHPAAQNYITTAKSSPDAPHFIAELAENYRQYREDKKETILFNGALNTFDLEDLTRLPVQLLVGSEYSSYNTDYEEDPNKRIGLLPSISSSNSLFSKAHQSLIDGAERKRILDAALEAFKAKNDNKLLPEHGVVASFASDFARFGQIDWNEQSTLDLHVDFIDAHQRGQKKVWDRVANIISIMKDTTFLDTGIPLFPNLVTLTVLTEFSRLPFLNINKGKDHNYFDNSILLGGRGINGGQSLGGHHLFSRDDRRSESQLSGCHIDFRNGNIVKNGYYSTANVNTVSESQEVGLIRPENILRTLGDVFNVDYEFMRLFSKDVSPLPKVLKS